MLSFLLFLHLIVLASLLVCKADDVKSPATAGLESLSQYKIKARITAYSFDDKSRSSPQLLLDLEEYHSNALNTSRSLIGFPAEGDDLISGRQIIEYYSSNGGKTFLKLNRANWSCSKSQHDDFLKFILPGIEDTDILSGKLSQLAPYLKVPYESVNGVARLLQLIDLNREQLKFLETRLLVRGKLASFHDLNLGVKSKTRYKNDEEPYKSWRLQAYFPVDENEQFRLSDNIAQMPIRLKLISDQGNTHLLIDIISLDSMPMDLIEDLDTMQLRLNQFSIDPRFDCSQALDIQVYNGLTVSRTASMRLETIDLLAQRKGITDRVVQERQFIAYDGRLEAFRRDRHLPRANKHHDPEYSTILHDLKRMKKYHFYSFKSNDCVASQTFRSLYEPLFPVTQMAFLGTGRLRGLTVDIYQHQAVPGNLPAAFFSHSIYVSTDGSSHVSDIGQFESTSNASSGKEQYLVVYYFIRETNDVPTNRSSSLGPLLRIDLYSNGWQLAQIDVFDFMWGLQASPIGDRVENLFSIPNGCSGSLIRGMNHMRLELQFKLSDDRTLNAQSLADLISSNRVLSHEAFRDTLATQSRLSIIQMMEFHLESRLWNNNMLLTESNGISNNIGGANVTSDHKDYNDNLLLHVYIATRLLQAGKSAHELYQPVDAALVSLRLGAGPTGSRPSGSSAAASPEECFFEAAHLTRLRSHPVLFAFQLGQCFIDPKPIYEIDLTNNNGSTTGNTASHKQIFTYSNVFNIHLRDKKSSGNRYLRAKTIQVEPAYTPELSFNSLETNLRGKSLIVPVGLLTGNSSATETISFEITEVDLDETTSVSGGDNKSYARTRITGAKLSKTANKLAGCRAECLRDLECWSYSICTDLALQQNECYLSNVNIDNETSQLSSSFVGAKKPTLTTETPPSPQSHIFQYDPRCHSYSKEPLDMFAESVGQQHSMLVSLSERFISRTMSASECASKCIAHNDVRKLYESSKVPKNGLYDDANDARDSLIISLINWCSRFEYAPLSGLGQTIDQAHLGVVYKFLNVTEQELRSYNGGLCMIRRVGVRFRPQALDQVHPQMATKTTTDNDDDYQYRVRVQVFEFRFEQMYDKQAGVRLREYTRDSSSSSSSTRTLVNRRKFIQVPSGEACARACFLQTGELVPYCRSFDFMLMRNGQLSNEEIDVGLLMGQRSRMEQHWRKQYPIARVCALNSVALNDYDDDDDDDDDDYSDSNSALIRDQLMEHVDDDEMKDENNAYDETNSAGGGNKKLLVWHYEPHWAWTRNWRCLSDKDDENYLSGRKNNGNNKSGQLFNLVWCAFVCLTGLWSGLQVALKLTQNLAQSGDIFADNTQLSAISSQRRQSS